MKASQRASDRASDRASNGASSGASDNGGKRQAHWERRYPAKLSDEDQPGRAEGMNRSTPEAQEPN